MRLHHVQVLCPPGGEDDARRFYSGVLGLPEIRKPSTRAADGAWFAFADGRQLHVGAARAGDEMTPSRAHFAGVVDDLDPVIRCLEEASIDVITPPIIPGWRRIQFRDPFGNNVEVLEEITQ